MSSIDPLRHPLLHCVAQGARWAAQDEFPCNVGPDLFEEWLQFIAGKGELGRFQQRLQTSTKEQRDETFAEIGCAYFIDKILGLPITEWEPPSAASTRGEFLVALPDGRRMFVEVKSPGWEAEVIEGSRRIGDPTPPLRPPRLDESKYVNGEAFMFSAEVPISTAVKKAYSKLPDTMSTLLLIFDDSRVGLAGMSRYDLLGTLYGKHIPGAKDPSDPTKDKEDGCFFDRRFERLGAVGILNYGPANRSRELRFVLFRNPYALATVTVPREAFPGREVQDGPKLHFR